MADINDVLERLVTDPEFRARLASDPAAALGGYELSPADMELLAASISDSAGDLPSGVEQRTSKSALVGLLASFAPTGGTGGESVPDARTAGNAAPAASGGHELEEIGVAYHPIRYSEGADELTTPGAGAVEDPPPPQQVVGGPKIDDVTLKRGVSDGGPAGDAVAAPGEDSTASRVSKVEALTIKQTAFDDSSDLAPPGSDDIAQADDSTASRVSKVEALTIKQKAFDDSSDLAPPGSDDVAQADGSTASRVSKVEALTIKQTAFDDSSDLAPPGSDDIAAPRQAAPPAGDDFLTIEDG